MKCAGRGDLPQGRLWRMLDSMWGSAGVEVVCELMVAGARGWARALCGMVGLRARRVGVRRCGMARRSPGAGLRRRRRAHGSVSVRGSLAGWSAASAERVASIVEGTACVGGVAMPLASGMLFGGVVCGGRDEASVAEEGWCVGGWVAGDAVPGRALLDFGSHLEGRRRRCLENAVLG